MEEDFLRKIIRRSIKDLQEKGELDRFEIPEIPLEHPKEYIYGDTSTPVSASIAKITGEDPYNVAQKINRQLQSYEISSIRETTVARPVFNNFYLKDEVFIENIKTILKEKENFGKNQNLKNQKVVVEYTDPNPFKEFHIGHLMSNSIGESLSRIIEWSRAKIKRANYQGDVGMHVAKAVWGVMHILKNNFPKENDLLNKKHIYLKNAYTLGAGAYDENDLSGSIDGGPSKKELREQIEEINKKIYNRSDKEINKIYDEGRKWSLEYFEEIYKKLDTKFDYSIFESEVAGFGKKIVEDGLKKGIFIKGLSEKRDGGEPIVFPGERFGLHTRVFINSEGLPTYEAKELALAEIKYKKYKYDKSVIITGNEVNDYFKVLLSAMSQIFPELAEKTKHIGHGMMHLPEGKMSSRTGNVITFESLLGRVKELVKEKIKDRDLSETEKKEIMEKVAIGALKYSILKQSIGSDIIYDFEKAISFEGDSGPYLQYSYARANSVLKKAKAENIKASLKNAPNEISQLEKNMNYFPEIIEKAGKEYEPHFIVLYLTELAREFNNYYAKNKIVDKNDEFSPYKVALTEAFSIIMKNGLWLLGIPVLNKM